MSHGDVETYFEDGRWRNRIKGEQDLPGEHRTLAPALDLGEAVARNLSVEHSVRGADGTVRALRRRLAPVSSAVPR
jgi:hypothetical protein